MAKSNQKWSVGLVSDTRDDINERIHSKHPDNPTKRLGYIFQILTDGVDNGVDSSLNQFVSLLIALEHHVNFGGLTDGDLKRFDDTARTILKAAGVTRTSSRLSFLLGDLCRIKSQIYSNKSEFWDALWTTEVANYLTSKPTPSQQSQNALARGNSLLRAGHANEAIKCFASVADGAGSEFEINNAQVGRATAYQSKGALESAQGIWQEIQRSSSNPEHLNRASWALLKIKSIRNKSADPMIINSSRANNCLQHLLEAKLWAFATKREE